MIDPARIKVLQPGTRFSGSYVLYWMQAAQRTRCNHALQYAIRAANEKRLPVLVFFGITDAYPDANLRHYHFMLQGLRHVRERLADRGISMIIQHGSPEKGVLDMAARAALLVTDRGYTRLQKAWRRHAARRADCPVIQAETDVIVPVETASDREEYAAYTIRKKINSRLDRFLRPLTEVAPRVKGFEPDLESFDVSDIDAALNRLNIDRSVPPAPAFAGGTDQAERRLTDFIDQKLDGFGVHRNDPSKDHGSHMSPYLQFGQISPLDIALRIQAAGSPGGAAYLEELIVRRELAVNFVHFNPAYDRYDCLPDWAKKTLAEHAGDRREFLYSPEDLEAARTHDPYWNAAQTEMTAAGRMHGYMRMYWGKKIIEWTPSPEAAHKIMLGLNNKYELDGRNPNGFAGVAWCLGKHDRGWKERPVFGKIRYMNARGLERKFDIRAYARGRAATETAPERPV